VHETRQQMNKAFFDMNRCILSLAFDNIVHAAEQDQISNVINA
jgi:hypothetical protein